jgi:hypothetical protein
MIQHFHDLQTARAQMRSDALALLQADPSADQAYQTILDVMTEFEVRAPDNDDAEFFGVELIGSIAGRLRNRGFGERADALQRRSTFAQSPEPSGYVIEILIGRSAGLFCGGSPGERRFALVRHLRDVIPFESADFLNAAEPILKLNASAVAALAAMLRQRAADFATQPRRLARIYDRDLGRLAQMQSEEMRFIDVWDDSRQRVVVWPRDLDAYELLRRADIDAYLHLLEDFELHGAVYQILEAADGWATTAELCLLLKGVRPVFDKDGEWIKRTRVAFIVINFLGSRLLDKPFENGEPSEKFKEILTETTKALTARPDAIPLGYAWLQRLFMSPGRTRRRPGMRDDGNLPTALILVAANLAPHLGPHPSPLKWIEAELYVWRNWRIYALLAVEICRQPVDKNAIATLVTQVLLNDLASSVGLDHLGSGPNIERRIIGNAIVQIPDLATWFADLWKRLFWQRDRFRWLLHSDPSRPNIGQVIVLWGASGLELLDAGSAEARSFWFELYGAIRESILTEAFRQPKDAWSIALRFLGALWLKTFPDDPPAGTPGSLEDLVLPWKRVDTNFAELIEVLDRYGVVPEQLRRLGVSGDLLRTIAQEADLRGQMLARQTRQPPSHQGGISAIEALAKKLDGSSESAVNSIE